MTELVLPNLHRYLLAGLSAAAVLFGYLPEPAEAKPEFKPDEAQPQTAH